MAARRRLDAELVRRELTTSRTEAQTLIARTVCSSTASVADKSARQVSPGDAIVDRRSTGSIRRSGCREARPRPRRVRHRRQRSACARRRCVDGWVHRLPAAAGRAAGRGARRRPRAAARTAARRRPGDQPGAAQRPPRSHADAIGGPVDIVVGDLSFISLRLVIPALRRSVPTWVAPWCCSSNRSSKPVVRRSSRGRGIITDPAIHDRVRAEVADALDASGAPCVGWTESPITGADGNHEFLVHARTARRESLVSGVSLVAHHERESAAEHARARRPPGAPHAVSTFWMTADDAGALESGASSSRIVRSPKPTSCSVSAATARCCAASGCSRAPRSRCSASTSGRSATSPRSSPTELTNALERFFDGPESGEWEHRRPHDARRRDQRRTRRTGAERGRDREGPERATRCGCSPASTASRSPTTPPTG